MAPASEKDLPAGRLVCSARQKDARGCSIFSGRRSKSGSLGYGSVWVKNRVTPKWVALVSGNMDDLACGSLVVTNFDPYPYGFLKGALLKAFIVHMAPTRNSPLKGLLGQVPRTEETPRCIIVFI